jgi:hypothetical protein
MTHVTLESSIQERVLRGRDSKQMYVQTQSNTPKQAASLNVRKLNELTNMLFHGIYRLKPHHTPHHTGIIEKELDEIKRLNRCNKQDGSG